MFQIQIKLSCFKKQESKKRGRKEMNKHLSIILLVLVGCSPAAPDGADYNYGHPTPELCPYCEPVHEEFPPSDYSKDDVNRGNGSQWLPPLKTFEPEQVDPNCYQVIGVSLPECNDGDGPLFVCKDKPSNEGFPVHNCWGMIGGVDNTLWCCENLEGEPPPPTNQQCYDVPVDETNCPDYTEAFLCVENPAFYYDTWNCVPQVFGDTAMPTWCCYGWVVGQ